MENNFKIMLEAMIDNSSLSDVQKKLAKERLKIGADISVEDFAKSKQEIEKQIAGLAANIKTMLGDAVSDKQTNQWAKNFYDSMISGAKQATKEQEKLSKAVQSIQSSLNGKGKIDYGLQIDEEIKKFRDLGFTEKEAAQKVKALSDAHSELKNVINSTDFDSVEAKNRAIISADEKRTTALNQVRNAYKELKTDASQYYNLDKQTKLSNNILNWLSKNTRASKEARQSLQEYYRELSNGRVSVDRLEYIEKQLKDLDAQQRVLGRLGKSLKDQFKQAGESFTQWISVSSLVMAVVYQLQKMPQKVRELDDAVTDFTMATGANKTQVAELINTYADLGDELSATVTDVTVSATEWLKQGKSIAETETLIKDAMILSKLGKLSSADSTKYLTSVMKSYKVAAKDTLGVVDKLSAVDMASATDVGGLAEGISTVANNARLAGVSMDKLLGYLAAVGEVSQEGMSSVGTAYNAIFARMGNIKLSRLKDYETGEDLSNVETVLKGVGIQLRDSQNSFRDFDEVLDETAGRWTSFSEVQQRAIANAFAGTHHVDSFITLMENYDNALKYSEVSMSSSGQAMEKFAAYEDSMAGHTEKLENAFIQLSNTFLNSEFLKEIIDLGTTGVKAIDSLVNALTPLGTIGLGTGLFAGIKNVGKQLQM